MGHVQRKDRNLPSDGGKYGFKMKQLPFMGVICTVMLFIVYRTTNYQYYQTKIETILQPFENAKDFIEESKTLNELPRGIVEARSDLELRPLWGTSSSRLQAHDHSNRNLLAMPVGIKQKDNVDSIVQKFIPENFTIILFHYDGNVDGWWDLDWSNDAIHIAARNQTKWWYAKRFLPPAVVAVYDYIFLWDEDLGVTNFNPRSYLEIVKSEGLEISQPALDPNSTDIHHRITLRARAKKMHRRVFGRKGHTKCSHHSEQPPCVGFVEGMAPVFSRMAWHCTWHLIQNDLVHGWGMDMKLGYCAQGDRTQNVGVIDSQYVIHKGIQTLGDGESKKHSHSIPTGDDVRAEIRKQSTWELQIFKDRWNKAVSEDENWVDPFKEQSVKSDQRRRTQRNHHRNRRHHRHFV
ncbi:uncharacterized protein LOC111802517 isoform X1 [Cucurbita pepo subsp. pepo]|uniref:uncharacterized protein LOC111802517 isoform X1 n=1 Tax=Cucurbita pepo subsp. pepo TaxID=3664 RepID=UPI000C9D64F3|nr:uncharacterized protein LOC111802517 isoform X1 [Cucurbita pepo subsp. pepo]XP_023542687.1 uncharacterized protein LOC111802517 isoform X1 [Cucurbita pepo subsp. pepo]XP_023542688.1 uncharacterized protein LOC111802517 isoform X1 [Cucurbita pepo subsp. pepo]